MKNPIFGRTTRDVTVDYLANLGAAAKCRITIPAGTPAIRVEGGLGVNWAVNDLQLVINLTGNTHDPHYRYCWLPDDAVEMVEP